MVLLLGVAEYASWLAAAYCIFKGLF